MAVLAADGRKLNGVGLRGTLAADLWHSCALWECSGPVTRAGRCLVKLALAPRIRALVLLRLAQLAFTQTATRPLSYLLSNRVLSSTGAEIHPGASIGPGLNLAHTSGIVIGRHVRIGRDLLIFQGVTIGDAGGSASAGQPHVGNAVRIGAGAKVLGSIQVGDRATIGANSVVLHDVCAGDVVVGAPARPTRG